MAGLFVPIYNAVSPAIDALVVGKYAAVGALVRGPLIAAAGIYMALAGYAVMRGIANEPWGTILATGTKIGIVALFATGSLSGVMVNAAAGFGTTVQTAIGGSADGSAFDTAISGLRGKIDKVVAAEPLMIQDSDILPDLQNPEIALFGYLTLAFAVLMMAIGFAIVLYAKLALALTAVFGPLFVGFALFDSTRGFFFGWLGAVLNLAILTGVVSLVANLALGVIVAQIPEPATTGSAVLAWSRFYAWCAADAGVMFLCGMFFLVCPTIAAGMASGAGGGAGQFLSSVIPVGRAAGRALGRGAASLVGGRRAPVGRR